MNGKWQQLVDLLTDMLGIYRALLTLSRQKREILVAADTKELERVTGSEEALILRAGKLEVSRQNLVRDLAADLGVAAEELTLAKLTELAEEPVAEKLNALYKDFALITGELTRLNELNSRLIKQALQYINYNINLLAQDSVNATYSAGPQPSGSEAARRTLVDKKI